MREPGQYRRVPALEGAGDRRASRSPRCAPRALPATASTTPDGDAPGVLPGDRVARSLARYDGASLPAGTRIDGPAIIREPTTTIVVYPAAAATVTPLGNYLLELDRDPTARTPERQGARAVSSLDPVTLAVIANRLDSIVREMDEHAAPHAAARRSSTWRATSPAR